MSNTTSTDPRIARAILEGRIPEEISIAYLEESRDDSAIGAIIFVTVLTGVIVILRIASRAFVLNRTGPDDWLAVLGLVSTSIHLNTGYRDSNNSTYRPYS